MRRKNRVPSYRLHRPSGQAVVTLSGRDYYLGTHGSPESHERYARLVAEWSAGATQGRAAGRTVSEVFAAYLAFAEGYYRKGGEPTKQLDRIRRSLSHSRGLYGTSPAERFGPSALQAARTAKVRQGWCRRVVNQRVDSLKRCFKWAGSQELVPPSVYEGLRCVAGLRRGRTEAPESCPVLPADEAGVGAACGHLTPTLRDVVAFLKIGGTTSRKKHPSHAQLIEDPELLDWLCS